MFLSDTTNERENIKIDIAAAVLVFLLKHEIQEKNHSFHYLYHLLEIVQQILTWLHHLRSFWKHLLSLIIPYLYKYLLLTLKCCFIHDKLFLWLVSRYFLIAAIFTAGQSSHSFLWKFFFNFRGKVITIVTVKSSCSVISALCLFLGVWWSEVGITCATGQCCGQQ